MVDKVTAMVEALNRSRFHKVELLLEGGHTIKCCCPKPDSAGMIYLGEGADDTIRYRFLWAGDIICVNVLTYDPIPA